MNCTPVSNNRSCHSSECKLASEEQYVSLENQVDAYLRHCKKDHEFEMAYFAEPTDIIELIDRAVLSKLWNDKMAPHQRRIGEMTLKNALTKFRDKSKMFHSAKCFKEVHEITLTITKTTNGLGALAAYDISTRIAAGKSLYPTELYVHAGVKTGANLLGLPSTPTIPLDDVYAIYPALKALEASDLENFICIFKKHF